jgi:hypothetical protein
MSKKDKPCPFCSYDANYKVEKLCGFCEAEAISARIKWWQDGKKELKKRNDS